MKVVNRWVIAIAGILMQVALGAVYAWSVFRAPLVKQFGWSISEVTLTFTISIFMLGIVAFFGGLWLNRQGPRVVALVGGALYGLGVFLASFSANRLWWLYLPFLCAPNLETAPLRYCFRFDTRTLNTELACRSDGKQHVVRLLPDICLELRWLAWKVRMGDESALNSAGS